MVFIFNLHTYDEDWKQETVLSITWTYADIFIFHLIKLAIVFYADYLFL